jgi:hypothetical protein
MYKRAANRVLVTAGGDILPRPSFLEHSLHRRVGASISQHLLTCYARSLGAVVRGQFSSKAATPASRKALRELAACHFVQVGGRGALTREWGG